MRYLFILPSSLMLLCVNVHASPGYTQSDAEESNEIILFGKTLKSDLESLAFPSEDS